MDSKRQLKFSRLIQKELADIFQRDARNLFGRTFITVTHVSISPDLSVAHIHLSLMLTDNKEEAMDNIREQTKPIRNLLAERIRKQVRIIPNLVFLLDESAEYSIKMNQVIEGLQIPPEE